MTSTRPVMPIGHKRGAEDARATATAMKPMGLEDIEGVSFAEADTATSGETIGEKVERRPYLAVLSGPREGELFRLEDGVPKVLGRGEGCDIRILDDCISRTHCSLTLKGDRLLIEDLGSRNGVVVGARRVRRRLLAAEDIVRLGGGTVLKYCLIDKVEEQYRLRMLQAALLDAMTGVYNRRYFDDHLPGECALALRHKRPLSLLLIDIDDFKQINDRYGHPTGDMVLEGASRGFQENIRTEDLLCRFGGEEFAVVARETDLAGGIRLAERLCEHIAGRRFEARDRAGTEIKVTVSVGVAQFEPSLSPEKLVEQADAALYAAKRGGKNRVVSAMQVEAQVG